MIACISLSVTLSNWLLHLQSHSLQHTTVLLNIAVSWLCHCKQTCTVQVLCDRLGIFVDGQLVCIGNPKELTARYGGYVVSPLYDRPDRLLCMASDSALLHLS